MATTNIWTQWIGTLANIEDPDKLPQNAIFHQGLHCLLRGKQSSGKETNYITRFILTCDPLTCTMDHSKIIVSNLKKDESVHQYIKGFKITIFCLGWSWTNFIFNTYCKFGNFPDNLFLQIAFKRHICQVKKFTTRAWFTTSVNDCDLVVLRGFYFHETMHLRRFLKIKNSWKFQYL